MRLSSKQQNLLRLFGRVSALVFFAGCFLLSASEKSVAPQTWQLPADASHTQGWAVGDLDGDRIADLAAAGPALREGRSYLHKIHIGLSGAESTSVQVRGTAASIRVSLRDVDGDHDRDLVVFETLSSRPLAIWLNDGAGHFREVNPADYVGRLGPSDPRSLSKASIISDTSAGLLTGRDSFVPVSSPIPAVEHSSRRFAFSSAISLSRFFVLPGGLRGPPSLL